MKIAEKITAALVVVAIILKFSFISGGDELLMISLTILATLYFYGGVSVLNHVGLRSTFKGGLRDLGALRIVSAVFTGMALSILCIGILFKLLELTGAEEMLLIGSVFGAFCFALFLIRYFLYKDAVTAYGILRIAIILGSGFTLLMVSNMTLIKWQYRNYPAYIQASEEYFQNPVDSLLEKRDLERFRIILSEDDFKKYEEKVNVGAD